MTNASIMPALGWDPDGNRIEIRATARGAAFAVGECVMLDIGGTDAGTTALASPGASDSPWANVITPVVTDNNVGVAGIYGIVMEAIADDAVGKVLLRGLFVGAEESGSVIVGSALVAKTDKKLLLAAATGQKVIGLAIDAISGTTGTVYFDGINGLGTDK